MKSLAFIFGFLFSFSAYTANLKEPVTFQGLQDFVFSNKIKNVQEFLQNLNPEQRKRYSLVFSSRSVQTASYLAPRVIMYTREAQMLMSFNGGGPGLGSESLEFILFDRTKSSFEMAEIDFSRSSPRFEKNPSRCLGCHGQDPRPIWSSEGFWAGVYGTHHNQLREREASWNGEVSYEQESYMRRFKSLAPVHERYRFLEGLQKRYLEDEKGNSILTKEIFRNNLKRMVRLFKANPRYDKFKVPLLALMSCDIKTFQNVLPKEANFSPRKTALYDLNDYEEPLKIGIIKQDYFQSLLRSFGMNYSRLDTNNMFRYLKRLDGSDLYDTIGPFSIEGDFGAEFAREFTKGDPELLELVEITGSRSAKARCDSLQAFVRK